MKNLRAGILLSRTPIVAKKPGKFEAAYYNYQDQLERRLMWTFPWYFYFKRGTLAQRKFNDLQTGPMPRHKGVYYPEGIPDVKHNRERRTKQEVNLPSTSEDGQNAIKPEPLETAHEADTTSLSRKLDSMLYLLINDGEWRFPSFEVLPEGDSLHEAAERGLRELGGDNINTWTVSNTPAAVLKDRAAPEFLVKSHILHGQFSPKKLEFGWFTKGECKAKMTSEYFARVNALL